MTSFDLMANFIDDPEVLLMRTKAKLKGVSTLESEDNCIRRNITPEFVAIANKSLHELSAPTTADIRTGEIMDLSSSLRSSIWYKPAKFSRKAHEDAIAHLQHFLEICSTFTIKGVTKDAILLHLFPFSLLGKTKQWFYANKDKNTTWDICSTAFLAKFFFIDKTNALRGRILSFQQQYNESVPGAWKRFQDYISKCHYHGMKNWLLMQTFYHGLTTSTRETMDAVVGGAFLSLTIRDATILVEKMASNES
jgi:hypothetical protein